MPFREVKGAPEPYWSPGARFRLATRILLAPWNATHSLSIPLNRRTATMANGPNPTESNPNSTMPIWTKQTNPSRKRLMIWMSSCFIPISIAFGFSQVRSNGEWAIFRPGFVLGAGRSGICVAI